MSCPKTMPRESAQVAANQRRELKGQFAQKHVFLGRMSDED